MAFAARVRSDSLSTSTNGRARQSFFGELTPAAWYTGSRDDEAC